MYKKEIIIKMIKKVRKLRIEKKMTIREIAKKVGVSKNSVNKRINMKFETEDIKLGYKEKRGFKKGSYRKYDKVVGDRIEYIYNKMCDEKKFFINENTILDEYKNKYNNNNEQHKIPTKRYIQFIQKERKLHKKRKKHFRNGLSKYMNYPENTIKKLGYISEGIDFVGPRNIKGDSNNYSFLSRRYDRPNKYGKIDLIGGQTTIESLKLLVSDWGNGRPIPDVIKIDNDSAYGMLKSSKHKNCIGGFTKRLLYLGIIPLYSAPRSPRNNGSVEGQNSVFDKLFWQEIFFEDSAHLKTELTRFNTEYVQYSELIDTTKNDIEKANVSLETLEERIVKLGISKEKVLDFEKISDLKKEDFKCKKICVLRKVSRIGDKGLASETGVIELLGNEIKIDKNCINHIVFCEIDIKKEALRIGEEIDGKLVNKITKPFKIANI